MGKTIVIGNGIAGYTVSSALWKAKEDVVQYSEEKSPFYSRIKLPQALCDDEALEAIVAKEELPCVVHARVMKIVPEEKRVVLSDGSSSPYDNVVLATGSRARLLPAYRNVGGISKLRTISDAHYLSREMRSPVCVLGGGLLGIEAARAAARKGFSVTVLEGAGHILNRQLDEDVSSLLRKKLEDEGLAIEENFALKSITHDEERRISSVLSWDGRSLPCSTLILSIGVTPEVSLASECGIRTNRGILVDGKMRTSERDIYAIGDCAEFGNMVPCILPVALAEANVVIQNLQGGDVSYVPPLLMTRLKDEAFDLISIGRIEGDRYEEKRGDGVVYSFVRDEKLSGAILLNASGALSSVRQGLGRLYPVWKHI